MVAAVVLLVAGWALFERALWGGKVLPGVRLPGAHVATRNHAALREQVADVAAQVRTRPLRVRVGTADIVQRPDVLALAVDEAATASATQRAGRRGNLLGQALGSVLRRVRPDEVRWSIAYDRERLAALVDTWDDDIATPVREGSLRFEGAKVIAIAPRPGTALVRAEALAVVDRTLRLDPTSTIELPLRSSRPEVDAAAVERAAAQARRILEKPVTVRVREQQFTLLPERVGAAMRSEPRDQAIAVSLDEQELHAALGPELATLETPGNDAGFRVVASGVEVIPSQVGNELDMAALAKAILRGEHDVTGVFRTSTPTRDTAWAQSLGIVEKVSEFTTRHPAGQPRVTNIHRAADLVQNAIVEPGARFSLNKAIGPRTADRGFVRAPVIYEGEFSEDVGGGVSQFATTFFNAVFFGGYKIVAHQAHSYFIDRYPMGREATISSGGPDLVFVNDSAAGILVRTAYTGSSITVAFYGRADGRSVKAEGPKVLATFEPGIDYTDDPALPRGAEKVIQDGRQGFLVEVFRVITRADGEPVRQRFVTRYKTQNHKVNRGIGAPTTTATTAPTAPPITTTTSTLVTTNT